MISLNSLAGFATPRVADAQSLGAISAMVWSRVWDMHDQSSFFDTGETAKEARRVLLGAGAALYDSAAPQAEPFAHDKVSWPEPGDSKPWLSANLPRHLADLVEGSDRRWMREGDQFDKFVAEHGRPKLHGCAALKPGRREYKTFVAEGLKRGVLKLGLRSVEKVKIFFTGKKDGGLRVIVDCRRSNQRFQAPPHTALLTGSGFCEVHLDKGAELFFGALDVKNAFFQHRIPSWLSELFSMEAVPAGFFGVDSVDGQVVHSRQRVFPQLAVVPQGWTWGLALVQACHEHLLDHSVLTGRSRRMVDFCPPPCPKAGPCHSMYVDNLLVDGAGPRQCERAPCEWRRSSLECGPPTACG